MNRRMVLGHVLSAVTLTLGGCTDGGLDQADGSTPTATQVPGSTFTATANETRTEAATETTAGTRQGTPSSAQTDTPTRTRTDTPTRTRTETPTRTQTETPTRTQTETPTGTATETSTETQTATATPAYDQEVVVGPNGLFQFDPPDFDISAGDTVRWVWDSDRHNVRPSQSPDATWSGTPGGDDTTYDAGYVYEYTFDVPGDYEYYCAPHRQFGMTGSFTVS